MNFPLFFILFLFLSHLLCHPSFAIRKLQDDAIDHKVRDSSMKDQDKLSFVEGDEDHQVHRKDLHEVHSGPNPIGNSIPQQKYWKTKRRYP